MLRDGDVKDLRRIKSENVFTAQTIKMNIAHSVAAAQNRAWGNIPRKAQTRSKIILVGIDESTVGERAVTRLNDRVGRRVEVRELIVALILRSGELVTQAEIKSQFRIILEIVLKISEVHPLAIIGDKGVGQLILITRAKKKISHIVEGVAGDARAWSAETAAVRILPVFRVKVFNLGVDSLVFVAGF